MPSMTSMDGPGIAATTGPPIAKRLPLLTRLLYAIRLLSIKVLVKTYILYRTRIAKSPPSHSPTYVKSYPIRPHLQARVFIPPSYKPSSSPPLPLVIDIHGGGFAIGHPCVDDADNLILSHDHNFLVVSIQYRLAPFHRFPTAVHDVAALMTAVLDDESLPFNRSRVAVAGYSAGGNLALAATQLNGLAERVKAAIAYYPATDFSRTRDMKLATATPPPGKKDVLANMTRMFNWGYVNPGQSLKDPLLSPLHADRSKLPKGLYLIGCEYDLLCKEAEDMAKRMAELEEGEVKVIEEEKGMGEGWEKGRIRWRKLSGVEHGFNQRQLAMRDKKEKGILKQKTDDMHAKVAEWLKEKAFS